MDYKLRDYQQECINTIEAQEPGAYIIQMATGLGKTATMAKIPRQGRVLLLSHREELVNQPRKYFDCSYGVERATERSNGETVVSASVQSMVRRLDRFREDEFDTVLVDEAHHSSAKTYRAILSHFKPRRTLGFTATPNRPDHVRMDDIYQDIIFQRDLRWGIQNGWLTDILCKRINIGYDLSAVHTRNGDYAPGELDEAMDGTADAIAQAYREHAVGATLIFAVSVRHAEEIAAKIPGAVVVTGETKDRASIIRAFTAGEIPCIVNCMVFTEGTDIPRVETVIVARPTQSDSLYTQMVGRGLRLYPGKKYLTLIDCVGVTGSRSLCTAPSLLGINMDDVPAEKRDEVEGLLFELPDKAVAAMDCPQSWIRNVEIVDLWAKATQYQTHDVNWFRLPDGSLVCSLLKGEIVSIGPVDELGRAVYNGQGGPKPMQALLDEAYRFLQNERSEQKYIWDLSAARRWGAAPASEKQIALVKKRLKNIDADHLTKLQASQIINRMFSGRKVGQACKTR